MLNKIISFVMIAVLSLCMTGCGQKTVAPSGVTGELKQLSGSDGPVEETWAYTENGKYSIDIQDKDAYIEYIEYATATATYLCADPSCAHNTDSCTSWIGKIQDAPGLFLNGDQLYLLIMGKVNNPASDVTPTLYAMNLDGSNRHIVTSFKEEETPCSGIAGDDHYLYYANVFPRDDGTVQRSICRCSIKNGKVETIYTFADNGSNAIYESGVWQNNLVLKENLEDSAQIYLYNIETGNCSSHQIENCAGRVIGDQFVFIPHAGGKLKSLDLTTMTEKTLNSPEFTDTLKTIEGVYDGKLFFGAEIAAKVGEVDFHQNYPEKTAAELDKQCEDYVRSLLGDSITEEMTREEIYALPEAANIELPLNQFYIYDVETDACTVIRLYQDQEVLQTVLPMAETENDFLVWIGTIWRKAHQIDVDGVTSEIELPSPKLALISKEDYYAGNAAYIEIQS